MKNAFYLLALCCWFVSCGSNEYPTIPLEEMEPILKEQARLIGADFVKYVNGDSTASEFRDQPYITPLMHRNLMFDGIYFFAPMLAEKELGKINNFELFQVVDKGVVRKIRYRLQTEKRNEELVELAFDFNKEHGLGRIYLYVQNNGISSLDKKRINLLSNDIATLKKAVLKRN